MANANDKPFPRAPRGDVRVETPDGVTRTFGDVNRQSLDDANYIPQSGDGYSVGGYGAFPNEDDFGFAPGTRQPTMRKPVGDE